MSGRKVIRRLLVVITLVAGLFPTISAASHAEETRQFLLALDLASLESAFQARQEEFRQGQISEDEYYKAYTVFATTDPEVQAATAAWLAANPGSTHAMTARGLALAHIAFLYRGADFAQATPRGGLSKMRDLLAEAIPLLSAAIDVESSNVAAAYGLVSAAGFSSNRSERDKGLAVIRTWAERDQAILSELQYTYRRWGGWPGATETYCADRTVDARRLTEEQCLAIADYDRRINTDRALEVLARGPVDMFIKYHIAKLVRADRLEDARDLAKANGYMTLYLAQNLKSRLGDAAPLERYVTENLKFDPLNPNLLAELADIRVAAFDEEGARRALDKAMIYGRYRPRLRLKRLFVSPPDQAFAEIVSALDATDYEFQILAHSVSMLMLSTQIIGEDAVRPPDFECQRLRILEHHAAVCKAGADHGSCTNAIRRDTIISEARLNDACGVGVEKSWQDYVRDYFGLNE